MEHNPTEIMDTVRTAIADVMKTVRTEEVVAVGVTNQRETTVLWDKLTGAPLYNAIVWNDTRTTEIVDKLKLELGENFFKESSGLPLANYFSAMKIRWLLHNIPEVQRAVQEKRCLFGNIDSWIIWVQQK